MTGYDEAVRWLAEQAPEWTIARSETRLVAGLAFGDPTARVAHVTLIRPLDAAQHREGPILTGEGQTILAAAQAAVGAISGTGGAID